MRIITLPLSMLFMLSALSCGPNKNRPTSKAELFNKWLISSIDNVESSYKASKQEHLMSVASTIYGLRSIPIIFLGPLEKKLSDKINNGGPEPYYSIILEYISRYAKAPQDSTRKRFESFRQSVFSKIRVKEKYDSSSIVIIESRRGQFKYYSESVAPLLLAFATTDLGQNLLYRGATSEGLLRIAFAAVLCRQRNEVNGFIKAREKINCIKYAQAVQDAFGRMPQGNFGDYSGVAQVPGGIMSGIFECLQALNSDQKFVQKFEDFLHCRADNPRSPGNDITPSGTLMSPTSTPPHQSGGSLEDLLRGATYQGSDETVEVFNPDGTGEQTDHHYTGADGSNITVSNYTYQNSDGSHAGTTVQREDSEGVTVDAYSSDGDHLGTHWEGSGSNSGNSYTADYNDNGTLAKEVIQEQHEDGSSTTTVVEYDANGNATHTTTYDTGSGNCTSGCDPAASTSMPVDEVMGDPCFQQAFGINREEEFSNAGSLDPWINPNPEGGINANADLTACLPSTGGATFCPPSLMYCVDETTSQCGCGTRGSGSVPNSNGNCQKINCGDGSCDPATGMCGNGTGGMFPPDRNPMPTGKLPDKPFLGLPAEFRSLSNSKPWQPSEEIPWLNGTRP